MLRLPLICLALLALALPVSAQTTLVELFASHNCRASDKAHETLSKVNAAREDVLILTWSVDYWDYLGEADPMATPHAKARQAHYVDKFGLRGAYTPQTVYDGAVQCPGNRPRDVERAIAKAQSRADDGMAISLADGVAEVTGDMAGDLLLVDFLDAAASDTAMVHPVTGLARLGRHEGAASEWAVPDCESGCALILQDPATQDVLAIARVR